MFAAHITVLMAAPGESGNGFKLKASEWLVRQLHLMLRRVVAVAC